jgi:hypothetical protein
LGRCVEPDNEQKLSATRWRTCLLFQVALVGIGQKVDLAGLGWIGLFDLVYGFPFSYLIGIGPAAVAGL